MDQDFQIEDLNGKSTLIKYQGNSQDVRIPNHVEVIGKGAFSDCTSLKSIIIEEGVKIIEGHVFNNCSNLSQVLIPKSIESIGLDTFTGAVNVELGIFYPHNHEIEKNSSNFIVFNLKFINLLNQEQHQIGRLFNLDNRDSGFIYKMKRFFPDLLAGKVTHLSEYDQFFQLCKKTVIQKVTAALCRLEYPLELEES